MPFSPKPRAGPTRATARAHPGQLTRRRRRLARSGTSWLRGLRKARRSSLGATARATPARQSSRSRSARRRSPRSSRLRAAPHSPSCASRRAPRSSASLLRSPWPTGAARRVSRSCAQRSARPPRRAPGARPRSAPRRGPRERPRMTPPPPARGAGGERVCASRGVCSRAASEAR
jgi:hypothetical protein